MKYEIRHAPSDNAKRIARELQATAGRNLAHFDDDADAIIAIGGDGFMLATLRSEPGVPVFGINAGSVGFLMNDASDPGNLPARIEKSVPVKLSPLRIEMTGMFIANGASMSGFNDVTLFRQTGQTAKLEISVDGETMLDELSCDGIIVSTPAGSTAYNSSAGGPVLPLDANLIALTPVCPFRPRKWPGALLPADSKIRFRVHETFKRPVAATADSTEARGIEEAHVRLDPGSAQTVLLEDGDSRYIREMFAP